MSAAAQRQARRKTARQFFDEDEEPPAKRSKVETVPVTNGANKATASTSAKPRTKKAKTSYDEDEDGFTFARKTRSKKATNEPVPVSKPASPPPKPRAAARTATRSDSKTDSRAAVPSSEADATRPKRRSARLSGDKEEVVQILPSEKGKRKRKSNELQTSQQDRDASPELPQNDLQVEKKRDGTKIALPFADTPVINRNKEMRAMKSKVPNRRSSVNSRGRRASSLIESGQSNAIPHADVEIQDFYKHISHSLLEPKRMRQLLTWSATRALPEKAHNASRNSNEAFVIDAARSIVEDLLKDFSNKPEMSDWFSREDNAEVGADSVAIVKKPNPRNAANAARLVRLEEDIKRLKEEEKQWNELTKTSQGEMETSDVEDIDLAALDPEQAALFAEIQPEHDSAHKMKKRRKSKAKEEAPQSNLEDIASRMRIVNSALEPQIDLFADGIHKMGQYRLAAERVADAVLGTTARKLEIREKSAQEATGTEKMGAKEALKALSGALWRGGEGR